MKVTAEEFDNQVATMRARHHVAEIVATDGVRLELYTEPELTDEELTVIRGLSSVEINCLVGGRLIERKGE